MRNEIKAGLWIYCAMFISWLPGILCPAAIGFGVQGLKSSMDTSVEFGWLFVVGSFIGLGTWSSSGYWGPWIKLTHPRLYTTVMHYLRERPRYYTHWITTSLRNRFDRLLFNLRFSKARIYRYRFLTYLPLRRTESEFRLLKLHPGNSWDIIKADLVSVTICEAPPFEAISYRWTSATEVPILLDGQRFAVSGEVHKLLRALRHQQKDRMLWLDSVCIDQKNDDEKSWQIGFMTEIYSFSEQVIGWIGVMSEIPYVPGPLSSLKVFGALTESPEEIFRLWLHGDLCMQLRASIIALCNEFFFRTWIIQEVALAQKLILKFGHEETTWEGFVEDVKAFMVFHAICASIANFGPIFHSRLGEAMEKIHKMDEFRSDRKEKMNGLPLSQLLLGSVGFHVTNPRDRIFGMLGLSTSEARTAIKVQYGTDTTDLEITIKASRFALREESSFRLLELGGIGYLPGEFTSMHKAPSWVPWWDSPVIPTLKMLASTCNKLYKTAIWAPAVITSGSHTSRVLQLQGVYVGKIKLLSHPWFAIDQILEANYRTIEEAYRLITALHVTMEEAFHLVQSAHHPAYHDIDRRSLVWRTICHESRKGQPTEDLQSYEADAEQVESGIREVLELLQALMDRGLNATGMDSAEGLRMGSSITKLRHLCPMQRSRLCVTENGYFGVVPAYSNEGDEVWAFLGAPNPFVLRTPEDVEVEKTYLLVGICYIDGIMNGELKEVGLESTQISLV